MSTVTRVNFEPFSDILPVQRRDFVLADPTLSDPVNAVALVDGEWMTLDASSKLVRASTIGTPGNLATKISFPLFAERGRYDVRAQAEPKMPILWLGDWESDTRIFDAAVALGAGAAITFVLQGLKVATITIGARNYTGLVGHGGSADTDSIVGHVTRLPAANGGKLRLRSGGRR
jgi:hypothetical protein